jgi:hypothetical protein
MAGSVLWKTQHHIGTPGGLTAHSAVTHEFLLAKYTHMCQLTVSITLKLASLDQTMKSGKDSFNYICAKMTKKFHSLNWIIIIHCMEQS